MPDAPPNKRPRCKVPCLQRGEVSAEVAAGVYFEERRGLVGALHRLLQVQALPGPDPPQDVSNVIVNFNNGLMSLRANGRSLLVSRLIELIGVGLDQIMLDFCIALSFHVISRQHWPYRTSLCGKVGMLDCRTPVLSRSLGVDWPRS